jgi:hypothetical protein
MPRHLWTKVHPRYLLRLSRADELMLVAARRESGGFHLASRWYLRGFEPLPYQYLWHHVPVKNTTLVAGVGTGKTTIVTASYAMDCLSLPGFKALNASVTANQAELAFQMFDQWRDGNPRLDKFVKDIVLRPYPIVEFTNGSSYQFRTAGQGARFIRGHEYDRANYDEAGLDLDGEAIRVLRGRLRGRRPDGSERMARLDVTGTPTASPWLMARYDRGEIGGERNNPEDLKNYFSMRVATWDNTYLTEEQVELMKAEYPADLIDIEMGGNFPDYGLSMFPIGHLHACVDASMNDDMDEATHPEDDKLIKPGWIQEEWPRVGCVHFEMPATQSGLYVIAGDPGTDSPPKRNAACIIVADVSERPWKIVYFHWIAGKGSYKPFLNSFKEAMSKYNPTLKGIDATGPQKALDELGFEQFGLVVDPLSFGQLKDAMLNSLLMTVTEHSMRSPLIQGLMAQMSTYKREMDTPTNAIPQDIVMTLAMLSYLIRFMNVAEKNDRHSGTRPSVRNRRMRTSRVNQRA